MVIHFHLDKIHGLLNAFLDDLLDLNPLRLGKLQAGGAASAGAATVAAGQVVVVLPGPVGHQVGVVGGGGVGHGPGNDEHQSVVSQRHRTSPGAAAVEMAEVIGESLQLVSGQVADKEKG